ncbi:hypothetical protein [Parvularcula sp. LCG005]|uniref:hypothetical protein n=1 Tax=Parvularcula sp. LCG005 TaxID=3078805 RepID=UPI0029431DC0|nr:hypothetical protein [Parvularcula sp. LCG005]WOI54303.1 hypothetical protein RUI03_04705 [Parvularcula sp. LCG005]
MGKQAILQSSLRAGELSPDLIIREDIQPYFEGAQILDGWLPKLTAGAEKCPGFVDLGATFANGKKSRLIPFRFNRRETYWIELTDLKIVVRDSVSLVEIMALDAPFVEADLDAVRYWQSADVVFMSSTTYKYPLQALQRYAEDDWRLVEWAIEDGPWLDYRNDGVTLAASGIALGASVTITASDDVFDPGHVGGLFQIGTPEEYFSGDAWQAKAEGVAINEQRVSDGKVYRAVNGGTTGSNQPLHTEGTISDGSVSWTFLHDGAGSVRITSVANPRLATGVVQRALPSTSPTTYWREGMFSGRQGFPSVGTIHDERVILAGSAAEPDGIALSRVADYGPDSASFRPSTGFGVVADDDGVRRTLADGEVNPILWLVSHERLYAGTEQVVKRISGPTIDEPITPNPGGIVARTVTTEGSADVPPAVLQDAILYVSPDQTRIFEHVMQEAERDPRDLMIRAEQVGDVSIAQLAVLSRPNKQVWIRRDDGSLYVLTYDRQENIVAFARRSMGGDVFVEAIAAIPGADKFDDLVAVVRRGSQRRFYRLHRPWRRASEFPEDQVYVDGAAIIDLWNRDKAKLLTPAAGEMGDTVDLTGPAGWLVGATTNDEIWWRDEVANSVAPKSLRVYRATIIDIDGDTASVQLSDDVPAMGPTHRWVLPRTDFTVPGRGDGPLRCLVDGVDCGDISAVAGSFTLEYPAAKVVAGDSYGAVMKSMPLVVPTPIGTSRGESVNVTEVFIQYRDMVGGCLRIDNEERQTARPAVTIVPYHTDEVTGQAPTPQTGSYRFTPQSGRSKLGMAIEIIHNQPFAATVLGMKVGLETNED